VQLEEAFGLVILHMVIKPIMQDPLVTDGDKYSVVLENERVRVLRYHDKPGDRTLQHAHADYVLYAESSFKRRLTFPDGRKTASSSDPTGWRILGFGKHPEIAAAVQEKLRSFGFQATNFVLTNDEAGDARLVAELKRGEYDGIAIGGYINGQDAVNFPATEETTVWFNRVLNIVHANAPRSKIILVRGPEDIVPAIERVLGKKPPS